MTNILSDREVLEFIRSKYPQKEVIVLHEPAFKGNEVDYLTECIDSTFVSYMGEFVTKFEESLKNFTGAGYCCAMVNGTSALHVSLVSLGIDSSCEVITQALTFVATANSIRYTGASPVFLDIDENNLGLDPLKLKIFLKNSVEMKDGIPFNRNTGKRIGGCIPVHVFGHACSIQEIVRYCSDYNIPVIEDAAEALGSFSGGKHLGTFGKVGVLSFNGNKIVTTGGGGAVITDDPEIANKLLHLSTTAKMKHPWEYRHDDVGFNYRMPNVNAAIGLAQMEYLNQTLKAKRHLAEQYRVFFDKSAMKFISEPMGSKSNYWLNAILFEDRESRDEFLTHCHKEKVYCRPVWELMSELPMYERFYNDGLLVSESIRNRLVNIPSSPTIE